MEEKSKAVSFIAPWGEIINLDECEGCVVSRYMTKGPVTVSPATPIGEIAQKMVDAHIHRVLVADNGRPSGIISSTDIMAAVANAARKASYEKRRFGCKCCPQARFAGWSQSPCPLVLSSADTRVYR